MGQLMRILHYCVDNGIRALGPIFVLIGISIISGVVYVLFYEVTPYYVAEGVDTLAWLTGTVWGLSHLAASAFLLFNVLFNYSMAIFVSPGESPKLTPEESQHVESLMKSETNVRRGEGFTRICKFCKKPKPPRTHHCHICKSCVLRMDHHCPWVSNCVGFNNHKYFVLFLMYLWLGCLYVAVLSFFPFYAFTNYRTQYTGSKTAVLFVFVMALSVMIAVGMLLGWHIYLVLTSQTTIEFYYNKNKARNARARGEVYHNEYDLGYAKNWKIFFGDTRLWFLPSQKPPPGDGIVYLTRSEHIKKSGVNHHFV